MIRQIILSLCALIIAIPARIRAQDLVETITYFNPERPPVIEVYQWDEKLHWQLYSVVFDSDGDWALDTTMYLLSNIDGLSAEQKEVVRKRDEVYHIVTRDGARFAPHDEERKNLTRLYPQNMLFRALEADQKFRYTGNGYQRLLQPPLPAWDGNFELLESLAYKNLRSRLNKVKLSSPPAIPAEKKKRCSGGIRQPHFGDGCRCSKRLGEIDQ
jgi:hypothetical protein